MSYSSVSPTDDYFKNIDISDKIAYIINKLQKNKIFISKNKNIWQSRYWDKGIGAVLIEGYFIDDNNQKIKSVLKIQGSKPLYSEPELIERFNQQNNSNILKLPKTLYQSEWDNKLNLEYYIFEKIEAKQIIKPYQLATQKQIREFYNVWLELKNKALYQPFIPKPKNYDSYWDRFNKWRTIRLNHNLKDLIDKEQDKRLLIIAKKLSNIFEKYQLEFCHRHLSIYDIKKKGKNYYIFSNLFYGWSHPLYDSIFPFEWHILGLSDFKNEEIYKQLYLWDTERYQAITKSQQNRTFYQNQLNKLHNLTIIERIIAALNLDILMIQDYKKIKKMQNILTDYLNSKLKTIEI
ncbi:MAG: hypothetical protein KatS3mg090_0730 [Patescibacteria group bacterium]|nr:MAG: hypothetical protein KatS3mg090_0730 [Patescibacteria group bacterium]